MLNGRAVPAARRDAQASVEVAGAAIRSRQDPEVTETKTLQRGDQVPRGDLTTLEGDAFSYRSIWQQKNLVLAAVPGGFRDADIVTGLAARADRFLALNTAVVVTSDPVPGLPVPGVLIADRWGEIVHVAAAAHVADLPAPDDLLEWIEYIGRRCSG